MLISGFFGYMRDFWGTQPNEVVTMNEADLFDWYVIWQTQFKPIMTKDKREALINEAKFIAKKITKRFGAQRSNT